MCANLSDHIGMRPYVLPVSTLAIIKLPALYQHIIVLYIIGPMLLQIGTAVFFIQVLDLLTDAPFEFGCEPAAANGVSSAGALMRCLTHMSQRVRRRDIDQCRSWARGAGYTLRMPVEQMQAEAINGTTCGLYLASEVLVPTKCHGDCGDWSSRSSRRRCFS